jgi:hypothetical protein
MVKMVHVVTPDCWLFDQSVRNLTKGIDKVHILQVRDDAAPPERNTDSGRTIPDVSKLADETPPPQSAATARS